MAAGLTDHVWSVAELLEMVVPVTRFVGSPRRAVLAIFAGLIPAFAFVAYFWWNSTPRGFPPRTAEFLAGEYILHLLAFDDPAGIAKKVNPLIGSRVAFFGCAQPPGGTANL